MGSPISQVQMPQTNQPSGKGGPMTQAASQAIRPDNSSPMMENNAYVDPSFVMQGTGQSDGISRPMGKGGRITYPGQSGQPQYGQPNRYSNTVGPWDNANIQQPVYQSGKGKGR